MQIRKFNSEEYIPFDSALLAQETLFQKSTFLPKVLQKVRQLQQILISRQYNVYKGMKFSSESKLFGEGPSHLRTTSATLNRASTKIASEMEVAQRYMMFTLSSLLTLFKLLYTA